MAARRRRLTDANVAKLVPAASEYTVWDTRLAGLGVRVRPSGHCTLVYRPKGEGSARRITLGPAALMGLEEARAECLAIETSARSGEPEGGAVPTFREFAAGPGRALLDRCKPSTRRSEVWVLKARLLPAFGSLPLDRITMIDVSRWFDEYSRTAPGGANHAMKVLRRILNHAVLCSHIRTNPTHGIKRNPRPKLTRFLSREEIRRLHRALDRLTGTRPSRAQQADIIRLLLLTGCRKSEIVTLRWQDVDGDTVNLIDAKTGPRQVYLNAPATRHPGTAAANRKRLGFSPRHSIRGSRFPETCPSGTRCARRPKSRKCAFMTSDIHLPATPSCRAFRCLSSPAYSGTNIRA